MTDEYTKLKVGQLWNNTWPNFSLNALVWMAKSDTVHCTTHVQTFLEQMLTLVISPYFKTDWLIFYGSCKLWPLLSMLGVEGGPLHVYGLYRYVCPHGCGVLAISARNRVSILAVLVLKNVSLLHSSLELGMSFMIILTRKLIIIRLVWNMTSIN